MKPGSDAGARHRTARRSGNARSDAAVAPTCSRNKALRTHHESDLAGENPVDSIFHHQSKDEFKLGGECAETISVACCALPWPSAPRAGAVPIRGELAVDRGGTGRRQSDGGAGARGSASLSSKAGAALGLRDIYGADGSTCWARGRRRPGHLGAEGDRSRAALKTVNPSWFYRSSHRLPVSSPGAGGRQNVASDQAAP